MTSLPLRFANAVRRNKVKTVAWAAFGIAAASGAALHHLNNAMPDAAARDKQWVKLQADLDRLADADSAYHALDDFRLTLLHGRAGAVTVPVDKDELGTEGDRLLAQRQAAQALLLSDLAASRDLSPNDLVAFRNRIKFKLPDARDDPGLSDRDLHKPDGDKMNGATALTLVAIWFTFVGVVSTAALMRQRSQRKRAAAQAAACDNELEENVVSVPEAPAPVAEPEPIVLVLTSPTTVMRPLTLKIKQSSAGFAHA